MYSDSADHFALCAEQTPFFDALFEEIVKAIVISDRKVCIKQPADSYDVFGGRFPKIMRCNLVHRVDLV